MINPSTVITTKNMDDTTTISKMVIEGVTSDDDGMYVCLATNVAGSDVQNARVSVRGTLMGEWGR